MAPDSVGITVVIGGGGGGGGGEEGVVRGLQVEGEEERRRNGGEATLGNNIQSLGLFVTINVLLCAS